MRHGPTDYVLRELSNEVPGGAELADLARARPEALKVTETQLKYMEKLDLLLHYGDGGELVLLASSSIRVELG